MKERSGPASDRDLPSEDGASPAHALHPADAEALDALVEHGFDIAAAVASHPALEARIRAAHAFFTRLESYPVEAPDQSLTDATLARIAREDEAQRGRMRLANAATSMGGSRGWHDFIAIACAAILIVSVGAPIMSWMQGRSAQERCGANLRSLGAGIASYLTDHARLPVAAGLGTDLASLTDWASYKNHRHLNSLVDGGYCPADCIGCGNDETGEGYAYQVPTDSAHHAWMGRARIPALADRNPVIDLSRRGRVVGTLTMNSPEHAGRGQNVLFSDGSIEFLRSPILVIPATVALPAHQENIWLPMDGGQIEDGLDAPREWPGLDVFLMQ